MNPKQKGAEPSLAIELYNLKEDPSESTDVAKAHPEIVDRMTVLMRDQRTPLTLFPFPALDNSKQDDSRNERVRSRELAKRNQRSATVIL